MIPFKRFKGKIKDLKKAILAGEFDDDDLDIEFAIDEKEAKKEYLSKRYPLSRNGGAERVIEKTGMKEDVLFEQIKDDWKSEGAKRVHDSGSQFIKNFFKEAEKASKSFSSWEKVADFMNSKEGQAMQLMAILQMLLHGDESGATAAMKGDSTNSEASEDSPSILDPLAEIEKSAPLWYKRKVQSILKDNMLKRPAGNRTSGELAFKRLYKIKSSSRVFQRKEQINRKQYNVVLLIDCSGSMSGHNAQVAAVCSSIITRDFQDLVRLKIKTFNRRDTVVKEFDEKFPKARMLDPKNRIIKECNSGNGGTNHDWYAVMQAERDLLPQRGEKMIISISDAEPCGGEKDVVMKAEKRFDRDIQGDGYRMLKTQNEEIHGRGSVRLMSIVVGERGKDKAKMQDLYQKNYSHISNYDDIYMAVTEVLSAAIKRK